MNKYNVVKKSLESVSVFRDYLFEFLKAEGLIGSGVVVDLVFSHRLLDLLVGDIVVLSVGHEF